jgi:toxin ParE1/3/4
VTLKVRFTPSARAQFLAAVAYINADRPSAAVSFRNRVGEALARLAEFPESGHILPEFPDLPFREVLVEPYRFFYRLEGDTVWVVGAWHGAQLPDEPEPPA